MNLLRMILLVAAATSAGCPAHRSPPQTPSSSLVATHSEAYERLRAPLDVAPRNGELVVSEDGLELRIERGDGSVPFLVVPRGRLVMGCFRPVPGGEQTDAERDTDWWIFSNEQEAVALELAQKNPWLWFWDAERDCRVRIRLFDHNVHRLDLPENYYAGDDVQLAYRWRQTAPDGDTMGVRDDGEVHADVLDALPGKEQLVLGDGAIALLRADGRALFQRDLTERLSTDCANTQLSVFGRPDGEVYVVATFETFGRGACGQADRSTRVRMEVAEWRAEAESFASVFVLDETRSYGDEDAVEQQWGSTEHVTRVLEVAGGTMNYRYDRATDIVRVEAERCVDLDRGTGVCLQAEPCVRTKETVARRSTYVFRTTRGVSVELGGSTYRSDQQQDGCGD